MRQGGPSQPSRWVFDAMARQAVARGDCRGCGAKLPNHRRDRKHSKTKPEVA